MAKSEHSREQLDNWERCGREVEAILEALERLERSGHVVWESMEQPRKVVAALYDIDLVALDKERREVLRQARQLHEETAGADG